jgi:hypothetical protein
MPPSAIAIDIRKSPAPYIVRKGNAQLVRCAIGQNLSFWQPSAVLCWLWRSTWSYFLFDQGFQVVRPSIQAQQWKLRLASTSLFVGEL